MAGERRAPAGPLFRNSSILQLGGIENTRDNLAFLSNLLLQFSKKQIKFDPRAKLRRSLRKLTYYFIKYKSHIDFIDSEARNAFSNKRVTVLIISYITGFNHYRVREK